MNNNISWDLAAINSEARSNSLDRKTIVCNDNAFRFCRSCFETLEMQITPAITFVFLCHVFIKKKFDLANHCLAGFNTLLPFLSTR